VGRDAHPAEKRSKADEAREHDPAGYYAVFVRDPAGNNLEIVCHGR
jgi:hypothetical protein